MNLTRNRRTGQPADPQAALRAVAEAALATLPRPLPDPDDEHERAQALNAEATELRADIAAERADAEQRLNQARQEAARIVGEAERHSREVATSTNLSGAKAARIEETAGFWTHAGLLRDQAADADVEAERLRREREEHEATATALDARIAELAQQRARAEADLEAARQSTDPDGAGEARTRLSGLDEVVPVLAAQRDKARQAAAAIGTEDSGGQLAAVLAQAASRRAERERVLDRADPSRVEQRRQADPFGEFARLATEHPEVLAGFAGPQSKPSTVVTSGPHGTSATVRR